MNEQIRKKKKDDPFGAYGQLCYSDALSVWMPLH